jgi:hypothetical protein
MSTTPRGHEVTTLQAQAWEAFSLDFETLLRRSLGKWVAYHGAKHECTAESQSAAYQECKRRGLASRELFVELVHPAALEEPKVCLSPTLDFPKDEP